MSGEKERVILTGREMASSEDLVGKYEISYFDSENPKSINSIAPDCFTRHLENQHLLDLLDLDEYDLQKKVKPTPTQNRLRLSFWREYDRVMQNGRSNVMVTRNIFRGIMAKENFYRLMKHDVKVVAWILKPPTNYVNMMEEALQFSMHRVREMLEFPLFKTTVVKKGDKEMVKRVPDVKVAELIFKIMQQMDLRVQGAIVKRVQQEVKMQTQNYNVNAAGGDPGTLTIAQIEAQIAALEGDKLDSMIGDDEGEV